MRLVSLTALLVFSSAAYAQDPVSLPASAPDSQPSSSPAAPLTAPPAQPEITPKKKPTSLTVEGQLFTGFRMEEVGGAARNEFTLERGELGALYDFKERAGLELRLESIRSAGADSFFGIDGDSIVLRVKRAFGYGAVPLGPGILSARLGLLADPWLRIFEVSYELRPVSPLLSERGLFFSPSDLGASISYGAFQDRVSLQYTITNGEGLQQAEQNNGKNSTIILSVVPYASAAKQQSISLYGGYRDGSRGIAFVPDHRAMAAVLLATPKVKAGFEYIRAIGYEGLGDKRAQGLGAWASATPFCSWLGLFTRADALTTDLSLTDATQRRLIAGVFAQLPTERQQALRVHLGYQGERLGANAAALPGGSQLFNSDGVLLMLSMQGARQF